MNQVIGMVMLWGQPDAEHYTASQQLCSMRSRPTICSWNIYGTRAGKQAQLVRGCLIGLAHG